MNASPLINAILAEVYIVLVSLFMFYGPEFFGKHEEDIVLMPIAMLSLLVLSAATMGFLFFVTPLQLYLDGAREAAVRFFLQTVSIFAVITVLLFVVLYLYL